MLIDLTPEQCDFVRRAVDSGRVRDDERAVRQALDLWVERERRLSGLRDSLDAAKASLDRGEGLAITEESMAALPHDLIARCAERLV